MRKAVGGVRKVSDGVGWKWSRAALTGRKRNIVGTGVDQIERVRVGNTPIRGEIVRDLLDGRHGTLKSTVHVGIDIYVLGAARRIVRSSAWRISRICCEPEVGGQELRIHEAGIGRRRAGNWIAGNLRIEPVAAGRTEFVPAAVDVAVAEHDRLVEKFCAAADSGNSRGGRASATNIALRSTVNLLN